MSTLIAVLQVLCTMGVAGLVACSANQAAQPASTLPAVQGATGDAWHLKFNLSGGFAGVLRELELASTGELKTIDRGRGLQTSVKASASELTQIASMIANLQPVDPARGSACRDCLQYDLEVERGGRTFVSRLNDVSLAGTSLEPLMNLLTSMLDRELSREAKTPRE